MLEAEGAAHRRRHIAPAMEVKAMADCTVAGRAHRYKKPRIDGRAQPLGHQGREQPSSRKSRKVLAITTRCSRQWPRPASGFWRDNLAPCMKNKQRHRQLGQQTEPDGHLPLAGKKEASATTTISTEVKGSRRTGSLQRKRVPHGMGTTGHGETSSDGDPGYEGTKLTPNTLWCKVERQPHFVSFC